MTVNNNTIKATQRADSLTPTQEKPQMNGSSSKLSIVQNASDDNINGCSKATNGVKLSASVNAPSWNGPQQDKGASTINGDPFTKGSANKTSDAKLSGSAAAFKPNGPKPAPISFLNSGSEADDGPVIVSSSGIYPANGKLDKGKGKATQQPIGTRGVNFSPTRPRVYFTTDVGPDVVSPGGHYIQIDDVFVQTVEATLMALEKEFKWDSKAKFKAAPPTGQPNYITFFGRFNDIRDAAAAAGQVEVVNPSWSVKYISQTEYANGIKASMEYGLQNPTSFYDGQAYFVAVFQGSSSESSLEGLFEEVTELAKQFGDVIGVAEMDVDAGNRQYRIEWYSISASKEAIKAVTADSPHKLGDWIVTAQALPEYNADVSTQNGNPPKGTPQKLITEGQVFYSSPTGRTQWTINEKGEEVVVRPAKQLPKYHNVQAGVSMTPNTRQLRSSAPVPWTPAMGATTFTPRSGSWHGPYNSYGSMTTQGPGSPYENYDNSTHPNQVRRERIQNGQDVRTTIMLRNLPREWTLKDFQDTLDVVSHAVGTQAYDFSYLRFDFGRNKGVGYAFVNFMDPTYILIFLDAYFGDQWIPGAPFHPARGPKMAEINYATIQGLDCVIERFRNSAVMDEYPGYRPKLWYVSDTAPDPSMIGKERPFPGVNNESKHQRSRDNAAQIGLYAPRSQHKKGGYRQRRSQYDRGTTAQIHEDAMYNQMAMQNGYNMHGNHYTYGPAQMTMLPPMSSLPGPSMTFGYVNPMPHVGAIMPPNPHGFVQFTDPFNGGAIAGPSTLTAPPAPQRNINNGRRGPGPRQRQPDTVATPRTYEQAVRGNAENAEMQALYDAGFPVEINGHVFQNHSVRRPTNGDAPRVVDLGVNEEGKVVNYSAYCSNNGANTNGGPFNGHTPNGGY